MRGFPKVAATALMLAFVTVGCGSQDYQKITEDSIVDADISVNLVVNAGFEDGVLSPWTAVIPDESELSITDSVAHGGDHSLRVRMPNASKAQIVSIAQSVVFQNPAKGTRYRFAGWFRTRNLSKELSFVLRFDNTDGSTSFASTDAKGRPVTLPEGDSSWTKLEIEAVGTKPLSGITVYPTDSAAFTRGVFWVDDVSLTPLGKPSPR